jgi:hypothetical protein
MQIREAGDGTVTLTGYGSVTGVPYAMDGYTEIVRPGAFRSALSEPDLDVRFLYDHGGPVFARTPKTLTLSEDDTGLRFSAEIDVANDNAAREMVSRIRRQDIRECSFAFRVNPGGQSWSDDFQTREIHSISLARGDISAVGVAANPHARVEIAERGDAMSLEQRETRARAIGLNLRGVVVPELSDTRVKAMENARSAATMTAARARLDQMRASDRPRGDFDMKRKWVQSKRAAIAREEAEAAGNRIFDLKTRELRAELARLRTAAEDGRDSGTDSRTRQDPTGGHS